MSTPNTYYSSEDDDSTDIELHLANLAHQCEFTRRRSSISNGNGRRRSSKMSLISIEEDDLELEFNNDDLLDVQEVDLQTTITEVSESAHTNATNNEDIKESTFDEEKKGEKNSKPSFSSNDPIESSSYDDDDLSNDGDDEEEGCGSYRNGNGSTRSSRMNIDESMIQAFAVQSKTRSPIPQVEEEVNNNRNSCLILFSSIAVGIVSLVVVFVALQYDESSLLFAVRI